MRLTYQIGEMGLNGVGDFLKGLDESMQWIIRHSRGQRETEQKMEGLKLSHDIYVSNT